MSAATATPASDTRERGRIAAFLTHHTTLKWLRYASVSAISTALSLSILGVAVGVFGFQAGWSNLVAVLIATCVSFELNRKWVWQRRSGQARTSQVIPFFALSLLGLVLSTIAVHYASHAAIHHHLHRLARTLVVEGANIAAFGTLWVVQFFLLDRVLFRARTA